MFNSKRGDGSLWRDTEGTAGTTYQSVNFAADRGSSMASKPVTFLLAELGVTKSRSRPHCSNDNPYSEAQFETLKYRPGLPPHLGSAGSGPPPSA